MEYDDDIGAVSKLVTAPIDCYAVYAIWSDTWENKPNPTIEDVRVEKYRVPAFALMKGGSSDSEIVPLVHDDYDYYLPASMEHTKKTGLYRNGDCTNFIFLGIEYVNSLEPKIDWIKNAQTAFLKSQEKKISAVK